MSRPDLVVVLLEDKRQEGFIRKYFSARGFVAKQIRVLPTPVGKSKDVNFVLQRYAAEVNAHRNVYGSSGLVVVIDADHLSVAERKSQLTARLQGQSYASRGDEEAIAIVVPARNIETWVWHLQDNAVDEATDYKATQVGSGSDAPGEVKRRFADYIITGQEPLPGCPSALQDARGELLRVPFR